MKRSKLDIERSLIEIEGWIVDGVRSNDIVDKIIANGWCATHRHAHNLIAAAKEKWLEDAAEDIKLRRIRKQKELEKLIADLPADVKKSSTGVMAVARVHALIIKLDGLATPTKIHVSGVDDKPIQVESKNEIDYDSLTPEILEAIINAEKKSS